MENSMQTASTSAGGGSPTSAYTTPDIPSITLPKGGGAIKAIDEKFGVSGVNGSAGLTIPFPFSPSRNGFAPSLGLSYNSGNGNGIFGLGWYAAPSSITRRTDKQLPQYEDEKESDVFLYSDAEDLVPAYFQDAAGNWIKDEYEQAGITVIRYRPRLDNAQSRVEKIILADNTIFWKVTTGANVVCIYGRSRSAQIADPADPARVFKWLLEFCYDDKGNCYQYAYKQEDAMNVPATLHDRNRLNNNAPFTNTYLKRVKYCNHLHFNRGTIDYEHWDNFLNGIAYLLELVLDYGEHDEANPQPGDDNGWLVRKDAFSDYRAGFEIRTYRLCHRVMMFHHFDELGEQPCLVRSLNFQYNESTTFTFLTATIQKGYIRKADGSYSEKSLPAIELNYEPLGWNTEIKTLSEESRRNWPGGIDGSNYQWIDLYGEGIAGILTEQANGWYYKSNSGDGAFDAITLVNPKPSLSGLATNRLHFQDLEADGELSLVSDDLHGFYERNADADWLPFQAFTNVPNIDLRNPNVKSIDLDGDGRPDLLVSEEEVFLYFRSKGKEGYDDWRIAAKSADEEKGPAIVFADGTQSIVFADMSGDGLMDLVRIRNSEVVYWPNLGYGKFGAKISMSNAPVFDHPDHFNPAFLKMADLDGSGATDLVYLGKNVFKIYFNQSGNSFSEENSVQGVNPLPFPAVNTRTQVTVVDLLGNGTGCIVWSSSLPADETRPLQYIDLMGGRKPHVLTGYRNNMGKEVTLTYRSSTFFYLQDKKEGKPWITRLPFPVQCVEKVELVDKLRKSRFTNQYTYHHGYYDQAEREFRGFGRVEQKDTEDFELYKKHTTPGGIQIVDEGFHQPPVLTKTWYHTGVFENRDKVLSQLAHEYYQNTILPEYRLPEPAMPANMTAVEWRQALRACKGMTLRGEVYAPDGSEQQNDPFNAVYHSCDIRMVQPALQSRYAVFMVFEAEALNYQYDRQPADPRIGHSLNIERDVFGNVLRSAAITYGRKTDDPGLTPDEQAVQHRSHIVFTQTSFSNSINTREQLLLPVLYESKAFELTGVTPGVGDYFTIDDINNAFEQATAINNETLPTPNVPQKRLVDNGKILFRKNDGSGPLPLGVIESLVLPWQSYKLALTPGLRDHIYGNKVTDALLLEEGKYVHLADDNYWVPSPIHQFDAANFYQLTAVTDPFGNSSTIVHENKYRYFVKTVSDALNNVSVIEGFNFRTLSPYLAQDLNDNLSGVRLDELGMVTSMFIMGKRGENKGDSLDESSSETTSGDQPTTTLEYDLFNYLNNSKPNVVKSAVRETHYHESIESGKPVVWQNAYIYTDGTGQIILQKIQAEPGLALQENGNGTVTEVDTTPNLRWIGNGRTILDNKGKTVKHYEPYFSASFGFEDASELVERGVTAITHYDASGRVVRTDLPNGSFTKTVYNPWRLETWDANDTVLESKWYADRITTPVPGTATPAEIAAANKAAVHAGTPSVSWVDALGRTFLALADNGGAGKFKAVSETDIQGNIRQVTDARGNTAEAYRYNMLNGQLYKKSMDSGERWLLFNVIGNPIRVWDSRDHLVKTEYDGLHRAVKTTIQKGALPPITNGIIIYGESQPNGKEKNLRGMAFQVYDTAGIATNVAFDFKGNPLQSDRQLCEEYKQDIDWSTNPALQPTIYTNTVVYDALNRATQMTGADNSIIKPVYNEAGLLNQVEVQVRGGAQTVFVQDINYNAKRQRESIHYGNNTKTSYRYDPTTFRLTQLLTTGNNGTDLLQKLNYTYDPVGNVVQLTDEAQQTFFFNNTVVAPSCEYVYDAVYRLIEANGREHIGQNLPPSAFDETRTGLPTPGDGAAMRRYTQQYEYDQVGNILQLVHSAGMGSYTRNYTYETTNNHLLTQGINDNTESFAYDAHGNIQGMSHLTSLTWHYTDALQQVNLGGGGIAYYVYDGSGNRIRKVIERAGGIKEERLYLGICEVFTKTTNGNTQSVTETLHIMDGASRVAMVETVTVKDGAIVNDPTQLLRYQYSNHLGSATLELDEQAVIISYEEYHPFGTTAYQAVNSAITAAAKRYRYTGMERDEETGLAYHNARYYIPWLARWLNADPIGISGGINVYAYCGNNPVSMTDTAGTDPQQEIDLQQDEEGNYILPDEIIVVEGKAPEKSPLRSAVDREIAYMPNRDEFQRQETFEYEHTPGSMSLKERRAFYQQFPEMESVYYEGLQQRYDRKFYQEEAKLLSNYKRIDSAAGVVKIIGGVTVVVAAGFTLAPAYLEYGGVHVAKMVGKSLLFSKVAPMLTSSGGPDGGFGTVISIEAGIVGGASVKPPTPAPIPPPTPPPAPPGGAAAGAADDMVTVYRFADVTDPITLTSRAATTSQRVADEGTRRMADPASREILGEMHAMGYTAESPFISVGTNPSSLANSTDPWLRTIATGLPGQQGVQAAPHLLQFSVPRSMLYTPNSMLSTTETELLFMGDNILPYLTSAQPNPFLQVPIF